MTTLKIRRKGTITLPASLRKKHNLVDGDFLTAIDLGEGTILLKPGISKVDQLSRRIEKTLKEDGVTLDELFETLREVRKEMFQERYGNVKKSSNDQG